MPPSKIELPADLVLPCPDLPRLADGQKATVLRWSVQVAGLYKDCQARHGAVVKAVSNLNRFR